MHIIISPIKVSPLRSCSSLRISPDRDLVFSQKQKELLTLFTSGQAGFNYCLAEMYKIGKQQGERK